MQDKRIKRSSVTLEFATASPETSDAYACIDVNVANVEFFFNLGANGTRVRVEPVVKRNRGAPQWLMRLQHLCNDTGLYDSLILFAITLYVNRCSDRRKEFFSFVLRNLLLH